MLVASDALSVERTVGSYMLSSCDLSQNQQAEFYRLHGRAESLLEYATTYDGYADELLRQHILNTALHHNITQFIHVIHDREFADTCANFTHAERTELTVKWGDDMELYILAIDDVRQNHIIPFILHVSLIICFTTSNQ